MVSDGGGVSHLISLADEGGEVVQVAGVGGSAEDDLDDARVPDCAGTGKGPRAYRFGKRIMFGVSDVRTWMDTMREPAAPTTFPGAGEGARG